MKINLVVEATSGLILYHSTLSVSEHEFECIKKNKEIPEKNLNFLIEFLEKNISKDQEIECVYVIYNESGREKYINCENTKASLIEILLDN